MLGVEASAGGARGLGYSYTHAAAATIVERTLAPRVLGLDALATRAAWDAMLESVRNFGHAGVAGAAIAALDVALWDLKARLLQVALADLLGRAQDRVPAYGSGGFTSASDAELAAQLEGWATQGVEHVKMKIGRGIADDRRRVRVARRAVGPDVALFVDANGAYSRKDALRLAPMLADEGVPWLEEPVSSDDVEGLRLCRDRAPAPLRITAGEYGWDLFALSRLVDEGAVDVLQPDATRCHGVTGFLGAIALCDAACIPFSPHTAPTLHAYLACASPRALHVEWFHDHAQMEAEIFDGAATLEEGFLRPDRARPGLGIELAERARRYEA